MPDVGVIDAVMREKVGKGSARAARREGRVPAVIYGLGKSPVSVTVSFNKIMREFNTGRFTNTLFDVKVAGETERVIPRDVQVDVVRDFPIHIDFLRISRDTKITVSVTVVFLNEEESPGLKKGGVVNIVRHEIELSCPADAIPEILEADLTGLEIGDSIHISAIALPEGVEPVISDRDFTVATIAAPTVSIEEEDAAAAAAAAEGEEGEEGVEGEEGAEGEEAGEGAKGEGTSAEGGDGGKDAD